MKRDLSEKEKAALEETPEDAIRRLMYWKNQPKQKFRKVSPISPNKALDLTRD